MNVMNISSLFNNKDSKLSNDSVLQQSNQQVFSEIFNTEKQNVSRKFKNVPSKLVKNEYSTNINSRQEANSIDGSNSSINKQTETPTKNISKASLKETKQLEIEEDLNTEETTDHITRVLDDILLLLQSLTVDVPSDSLDVDNESKINLCLNSMDLENLIELKEQLSLIVDTINSKLDQQLESDMNATLSMITQIINEALLSDKDVRLIEKENIDEMLQGLEELKNSLKLISKDINHREQSNALNLSNKRDLLGEENLSKVDTESSNFLDIADEEGNVKVRNIDKSLLENNNESQDLLKQQQGQENLIANDHIVLSQQEKVVQTINVNTEKNQIIEPKQFISEIAQKASAFLSKDKNEMSIQLTPENLGKISIKIGLNDGTLTGKIYAENYSVKEIIEANLNQLRDTLEEKGLNIAGLEVNVGDDSQNFSNRLFQQRTAKRQKTNKIAMEINNGFMNLEESMNQKNPYLISGQFDGLA